MMKKNFQFVAYSILIILYYLSITSSTLMLKEILSLPFNLLDKLLRPFSDNSAPEKNNFLIPNTLIDYLGVRDNRESSQLYTTYNHPYNQFSNFSKSFFPREQESVLPRYYEQDPTFIGSVNVSNYVVTPLFGGIHQTAYFFADGILGSNFQRQSLIIDTGSSVLSVACGTCASCGFHLDPPYICSATSGCLDIPCSASCRNCYNNNLCLHCIDKCPICSTDGQRCAYDVHYAEGSSISGSWHLDHFYFPNYYPLKPTRLLSNPILTPIGCHHKETNLFLDQAASGILGLQYSSIYGPKTFLDSAFANNSITKKLMSICLAEEGGLLALGRSLDEYHTLTSSSPIEPSFISWIVRLPHQKSYQVRLLSIQVADLPPINISGIKEFFNFWSIKRYATLDSGTTLTYFPPDIYNLLMASFQEYLRSNKRIVPFNEFNRHLNQIMGVHPNIANEQINDFYSNIRNLESLFSQSIFEMPSEQLELNLPADATPRLMEEFVIQNKKSSCWYLPGGNSDLKEFPVLKFKFESYSTKGLKGDSTTIIEWHPKSYLYSRGSPQNRCLSIESHQQILLGATFFINKDIIFDFDNINRIGIAEADCPQFNFDDRYKLY